MHLVDDENRETRRKPVSLPVHIEVTERTGNAGIEHGWLLDISPSGAGFRMSRPIDRGRIVRVRANIPKEFRLFDFTRPDYVVWGVVRRCLEMKDPSIGSHFAVGVAFIGKNAPHGHSRKPSAVYELADRKPGEDGFWTLLDVEVPASSDAPLIEKRRHTRLQMAEPVILQLVDPDGAAPAGETTVTENVSRHGASIFSQLGAAVGSFVRVKVIRHDISLIAIVRDKHIGPDAMPRLHVEFIDSVFPLDGIE